MKIIPAVDIIEGKTVRLMQGKYDHKTDYNVSPVDAAREWESAGAELIHVIDLEGAKKGHPINLETAAEIARAVDVPVQLGGGFRKEIDIKKALDSGIWRVIIGSKAIEEEDFARDILTSFRERVILSVDADKTGLKLHGWQDRSRLDVFETIEKFVSFGAEEMIFTDISKDGTLKGPDIELLKELLPRVKVKLIYAGGIKDTEDILELKKLEKKGLAGVIIGRALYDGTIDLKEAIDACKADNPVS